MKCSIVIFLLLYSLSASAQTVNLEDYVAIAQERSPLLREYRNTISAYKIDSQLVKASFKPQLSAATNNFYYPTGPNFGYDAAVTNGGAYSTVITATKAFASKYNREVQYRAVQLSADSSLNSMQVAIQDIKRMVATQYLSAYGSQQQLQANIEINQLLKNEALLLENLTKTNIYRQTDYLTFLVTLKQQELQLRQSSIQYQTDYNTLNYQCGIVDTAAAGKVFTLPELTVQLFPDLYKSVFFQKYVIDSVRLVNDAKLINLAYRPKLNAVVDAGYMTSQVNTINKTFGTSFGFRINLPIYDGGRRKLSLQQVAYREDTRKGYKVFFSLQYRQQIDQLQQQLKTTDALIQDITDQIKYSKGLIDVNEKLLQTGDAKISDFVIAINNYLNARTLLTQNRVNRLQIITQINYWNR